MNGTKILNWFLMGAISALGSFIVTKGANEIYSRTKKNYKVVRVKNGTN